VRLDRRGFFSIDALFVLILLVTISGVLLNVSENRAETVERVGLAYEANMIAEKLAAIIDTVYANGGGSPDFELELDLPPLSTGHNYTVSFDSDNREVIVDISGVNANARASVIPRNVVFGNVDPNQTVVVRWVAGNIEVVNA